MSGNRTRDARDKFALGGLVVKAGLRNADRAFLLGVLTQAATIETGSDEYRRLVEIGDKAFLDAHAGEGLAAKGEKRQTEKMEKDAGMRSTDDGNRHRPGEP